MEDDYSAGVYCCKFSHYGMDYIAAGSINTRELQIFEKDIVYMPSWTVENVPKGVSDLGVSPLGDMICLANGASGLTILNVGKII